MVIVIELCAKYPGGPTRKTGAGILILYSYIQPRTILRFWAETKFALCCTKDIIKYTVEYRLVGGLDKTRPVIIRLPFRIFLHGELRVFLSPPLPLLVH